MDKIVIQGGKKLNGKVKISGAKNAALPLLASSLLTAEENRFSHMPDLADIRTMCRLLSYLGCNIDQQKNKVIISAKKIPEKGEAPYELVRTMRASVLVLGPLLARTGYARVSLPGGCAIGARPINFHLKALSEMGAEIDLQNGYVEAKAKKLKGAKVHFEEVTVTGTENIMMSAVLANGTSYLENAACEPEVVDLAQALKKMGAKIQGEGTPIIEIEGVKELHGIDYEVMPDRIEAGTFLMACAMTGGEIELGGVSSELLPSLIEKLKEAGLKISENEKGLSVKSLGKLKSVDISTKPYPGFPTDFQAQFMAMMCLAQGTSVIKENIFENRFMHVAELNRMGANISIDGNTAVVKGVKSLFGAPVMATDLRASASLILAGLAASGTTEVLRIYHLDRGYESIEKKLKTLGASIRRTKEKS